MLNGRFAAVWCVDFEFTQRPGEPPVPLCLVGHDLVSGRRIERWLDETTEPLIISPDSVLVAYYASAEIGCYLALGWPLPANIIDMFVEFRIETNGLLPPGTGGLPSALRYYGHEPAVSDAQKSEFRQLAARGGPFTSAERAGLLEYCGTDADGVGELLHALGPRLDVPRSLLRGNYMCAAARIERTGVPIDASRLRLLEDAWPEIRLRIAQLASYRYPGLFWTSRDPVTGNDVPHFSERQFSNYLRRRDIDWPRLPSGAPKLDHDTFSEMVELHPELRMLRDARHMLGQLRLNQLSVGVDGRNRALLSAFAARTSRNQPSNSKFVFGLPAWLRGLIRPEPGRALAYVDWSQQEFGTGAALALDPAMMSAYASGDPYLAFAIRAGAVPRDATKETHGVVRERYKRVVLATQYLMGVVSLARWLGISEPFARELLDQHRRVFRKYWEWSDSVVVTARMRRRMETTFGWRAHVGSFLDNERSIRNWPIQSSAADMLRIACVLATEAGVSVCAPVHDALLVEAAEHEIADAVAATQRAMREASEIVLDGFALRSEAKIFAHGSRFVDPRGAEMWREVHRSLGIAP